MSTPLSKFLSTTALLIGLTTAARADLTTGLVSYWPLDANDTVTTPDFSFNNAMSLVGPVAIAAGQFSNSFTFNGSSTWLTNFHTADNNDTGLPIYGAASYSVAFWVKGAAQ